LAIETYQACYADEALQTRHDSVFTLPKFGQVTMITQPYQVSDLISHRVRRVGTVSDLLIANLGAVDHQIEDRRKKSALSLFNRSTAFIAPFILRCFFRRITTLLLCVIYLFIYLFIYSFILFFCLNDRKSFLAIIMMDSLQSLASYEINCKLASGFSKALHIHVMFLVLF